MKKSPKKFITFEGVEGAGKSTLLKMLAHHLEQNQQKVYCTREPGGTALGQKLRQLLLHEQAVCEQAELFMYLADRAEHVQSVIIPKLAQGYYVLCDRFNDATIAYQEYGRQLSHDFVRRGCAFATSLQPDLTVLLDLDPQVGLSRALKRSGKADRIEQETLAFHARVRQGYLELAKDNPQRFLVLDAQQLPQDLFKQLHHHLEL